MSACARLKYMNDSWLLNDVHHSVLKSNIAIPLRLILLSKTNKDPLKQRYNSRFSSEHYRSRLVDCNVTAIIVNLVC